VDCPSCGHENASDRVECLRCEALLVDVFESNDQKTDPMVGLGGFALEGREEADSDGFERLRGSSADTQYTGDLPRLFRFGNRYQVLEKLGEGGMGRVYKALDLELDRAVALKTIRTEKGTGPDVLKRFKQELVLARKITHKNVVRIYDLGESEGMKFFTMELVEGQSLRDLLREKKTIPVKEVVSYMKQMLSGLAEAHGQGVVHRDLKPHNVMVDRDGVLRIMDFGIARTADTATLTGTSEMMGTPDYISPEQVKGETATAQSDLYSVGVILYELLTGECPFQGDTAISKVVARLQVKPIAPRTRNPEIPPYLERIILKLMEVDPELRYQTAEDVLLDFEREQVDRSIWLRTRKALARRRGAVAASLTVMALALGAFYYRRIPEGAASADVPVTTLAVLPFHNLTANAELQWMENGLPEMLITDVSQSRALRPVLADRIDAILRDLGKRGQSRLDPETIESVADAAIADYSLHGSFVESQGHLRLDLMLRQSGTGVSWPIKIDGASSEIFALVDEITSRISQELDIETFGETDRPFVEVSTSSLEAFRAYYQGRSELQKGSNQAAVPLFQEAVRQDPSFAMAHARLAETYFHLGDDADAKLSIAAAEALAREAPLPLAERYQVHAIAARIQDDPETAIASYRELAKLYPDDPDVLNGLASTLETSGVVEESFEVYQRVLVLSPRHGAALLGLGRMMVVNGKPKEAIPRLDEAIRSGSFEGDDEALGMIHSILGVAQRDLSEFEKARVEFEKSLEYRRKAEDLRGVATSLSNLASVLRRLERADEARDYLNQALALARETNDKTMESLALLNLGNEYSDSGDLDQALDFFRQSLDIEQERNEHTELAVRLDVIAEVLRKYGLLADAMVYLDLANTHLEQASDPSEQSYNLIVRGEIARSRGDYDAAQAAFLESLHLFQNLGAETRTVEAHLQLASLYASQGRFDEALKAADAAQSVAVTPDSKVLIDTVRAEIVLEAGDAARASELLALAGDGAATETHYAKVRRRLLQARTERAVGEDTATLLEALVKDARDSEFAELELAAKLELARVEIEKGRVKEGVELLESVSEQSARRRLVVLQAEATLTLTEVHASEGRVDEVRAQARSLGELLRRIPSPLLAARGYSILAEVAEASGNATEASELRARVEEAAHRVLPNVPPELQEAFSEQHPWAKFGVREKSESGS
jgi:tetratricopeptide (TPR) repeat protein